MSTLSIEAEDGGILAAIPIANPATVTHNSNGVTVQGVNRSDFDATPIKNATYWEQVHAGRNVTDLLQNKLKLAEAERDLWRDVARAVQDERAEAVKAKLQAVDALNEAIDALENPRPFTADDITDEMVERGRRAWLDSSTFTPVTTQIRAVITAALTEPPARPAWEDAPAVWVGEGMYVRDARDGFWFDSTGTRYAAWELALLDTDIRAIEKDN